MPISFVEYQIFFFSVAECLKHKSCWKSQQVDVSLENTGRKDERKLRIDPTCVFFFFPNGNYARTCVL